jgi:hypothetical protein
LNFVGKIFGWPNIFPYLCPIKFTQIKKNIMEKRTYLKVSDKETGITHEGWFLKYAAIDQPINNYDFHEKLIEVEFKKYINSKNETERLNFKQRLDLMIPIDYYRVATKYNQTLLVRQIGSYMFLTDELTITAICQSDSWPTDNEGAEIVVCENDLNAEQYWIEYLQKEYPNVKINVLNGFRDRSVEDVRKHFNSAKFITFTTTFSNCDWVGLLFNGLLGLNNKTVLSHCFNGAAQKDMLKTFSKDIKIFESNGDNIFKVISIIDVGWLDGEN